MHNALQGGNAEGRGEGVGPVKMHVEGKLDKIGADSFYEVGRLDNAVFYEAFLVCLIDIVEGVRRPFSA
jgi:hypothetical protein